MSMSVHKDGHIKDSGARVEALRRKVSAVACVTR